MKTVPGLKLTVTLPDGEKATRITRNDYTHVCAFLITDLKTNTVADGWGAQWSKTLKGAQSAARKWATCPAAKQGLIKVETKIIQVWA